MPEYDTDRALADLDTLALRERVRELEGALKAVFELAAVSTEGDPWYAEHEGVDAKKALALGRAALADHREDTDG